MGNKSDEEYVVDMKYEGGGPLSPSDPTPSLLERKEAQKRTASPSIMKETRIPHFFSNLIFNTAHRAFCCIFRSLKSVNIPKVAFF